MRSKQLESRVRLAYASLVMASRLGREIMRVQIPHPRQISGYSVVVTSELRSLVSLVQFQVP